MQYSNIEPSRFISARHQVPPADVLVAIDIPFVGVELGYWDGTMWLSSVGDQTAVVGWAYLSAREMCEPDKPTKQDNSDEVLHWIAALKEKPDDDINVLVQLFDGSVWPAYHDADQGWLSLEHQPLADPVFAWCEWPSGPSVGDSSRESPGSRVELVPFEKCDEIFAKASKSRQEPTHEQ